MHIKHIAAACLAGCTTLAIAATAAPAQFATVTSMELSVRRGPGLNYPSNFTLKQGDRVEIVKTQGNWSYVIGARGGEGWVDSRFLSVSAPTTPPGGNATNDIFKGQGTIDNARFNGQGTAQMVAARQGRNGSLFLSSAGRFSIEYIGSVRSNFEGKIELQVNQFRSSEKGFRTVPASGTCNIQVSAANLVQSFCTIQGAGIDHGRSNFRAR